jgi:plastocyanin
MARRNVIVVLAVLAAVALSAPAAATATTFYGKVGPSMTITLKRANGKVVRRVAHGTHTFVIRDRSSVHNFHLLGPGVNRKTRVGFVGRRTWRVTLSAGTYRYRCDPHRMTMRGRFKVV